MITSYPTVFQLGHRAIADIFKGDVIIEEKIDGSQFSFGIFDGCLECRSKGKSQLIDAPDKMFENAIQTIKELQPLLHADWKYCCEYLQKPKHNVLAYERVPVKNLIIFDICTGIETYLSPEEKRKEAERIGLEVVPCVYEGEVTDFEMFKVFLERTSVLGGQTVEGVVIKNYSQFTMEKKAMMGKYVRESYKEKHAEQWKANANTGKNLVQLIVSVYKTEARWQKAVQHLRDAGELEGSPRDIGKLVKEIPDDVFKECEDEIKDKLFSAFKQDIARGFVRGFAEWYKEQLAQNAFER